MYIPNSFSQCLTQWLVILSLTCASLTTIAQDNPATASSSSASSAPPEKPIYTNNSERDNALLAQAFTAIAKADELQWLETPDEKLLTLYKAGETRKPKGSLLIMHAPDVPQLWPANLENIRRNLPLYGWATMALPLPAKYPDSIPEREISSSSSIAAETTAATSTSSSNSSAPASEAKPLVPRNQFIAERVDAAMVQLNKIGQFNVVVMVDNSSAPDALAALYKKINKGNTTADTIDGPLQALILVNLQDQETLSREQLSAIFAQADLPVMDVFFNPDNKAQSELRRVHQAEAMRQNLKYYQQLVLPVQQPASIDDTQSFWLGKVHGFVTTKAEGNETSKGTAQKNVSMQ